MTIDKNGEKNKISVFLKKMIRLADEQPDQFLSRSVFEEWELSYHPRPFPISGSLLSFSGAKVPLPSKHSYIVFLAWNPDQEYPELIAETGEECRRFQIDIRDSELVFTLLKPASHKIEKESSGDVMEVMYDLIQLLLEEKPDADIFRLRKKDFTEALKRLDEIYDPILIRRICRFSAGDLKDWLRKAAEDMALEDLSSQLHLPLNDSYAFSAAGPPPEGRSRNGMPHRPPFPVRTLWTIIQEAACLLTLARLNEKFQRDFHLSLSDCTVITRDGKNGAMIRMSGAEGLPLFEGCRMAVFRKGASEKIGNGFISLMDGDTLFVELEWDDIGDADRFEGLYLQSQTPYQEMLSNKIKIVHDKIKKNPETVQGALRTILGFDPADVNAVSEKLIPPDKMDFSQQYAWKDAVNPANPVVVVQGPPGTGKTAVSVQVIRFLCGQGLRVLVTAPTNTAVDNVCRAIADLPVLRFGQAAKVDAVVRSTCWSGDPDNVEAFTRKIRRKETGCIYAATHVRAICDKIISKDFETRGLFDAVLFDEAGMTRMDEFLLCAQMGKRVILFGDQQQLPPYPFPAAVISQLERKYPYLPRSSSRLSQYGAMEWLAEIRNAPAILLQRSYRCQNPRLMRFSSTLFYHARVKTSETAEYFRLPYHERQAAYPPSTLRFYCTSSLPGEIRREAVVRDDAGVGIENPCEARICRYVLLDALTRHPAGEISVISPYKRQIMQIRSLLSHETVAPLLPASISADAWETFLNERIATVDSFQGGESDLVIISYVRSNTDGGGIGFVDNPNRINVAHTRCRKELIVIGDLDCLKEQAKSDIFIRMERAFDRDGEILDVDEGLFEGMAAV